MMGESCGSWFHGECEGTSLCPPRCPRYFDDAGRSYVVRPFEPRDRTALVAMYRDYPDDHRSMGVPPRTEVQIRDWLDALEDSGRNFVAVYDDDVVGHAGFAPADTPEPEMLVYVDPAVHGRGLGTELTKHVVAFAAEDDCDAVALDVDRDNAAAIHVYRDLGFKETDSTPMEIEMELHTDTDVVLHIRRPPAERDVPRPEDWDAENA
jgi:RimJ/RimL family protein N-acetyltransferase